MNGVETRPPGKAQPNAGADHSAPQSSTGHIQLYFRHILSDVIGEEHGLSRPQLASLAEPLAQATRQMADMRKAGKLAYRELPHRNDILESVQSMANQFEGMRNLVVLGIGGSALGNIALQTALSPFTYNLLDDAMRGGPRLFVMDNVDPAQFTDLLDFLDGQLDQTVFNVISKSGETAETATQMLIVRQMLIERFGADKVARHLVATTDSVTGTLRQLADAEGYPTLEVPAGVGGRFSVLSAVGLFSATMCGIDCAALLAGAASLDQRVSAEDVWQNPAAIGAAIQYLYYQRKKPISVMMPYVYALKDVADWYRQLWAESLGKKERLNGQVVHIGPTPVKALGTTDQHSQVQLYREGPNDKVFTFLQAERFDADQTIPTPPDSQPSLSYLGGKSMAQLINHEKTGTEYALLASQRPCVTIRLPQVDAYTVGQLLYLLEVQTSYTGMLFSINPYDQPAVQLGKDATFALMGREGHEQLKADINATATTDKAFLV